VPVAILQPIVRQRPELRPKALHLGWLGVWILAAWFALACFVMAAFDYPRPNLFRASAEEMDAWQAVRDRIMLFNGSAAVLVLLAEAALIVLAICRRRGATRLRMEARAMRANARASRDQQRSQAHD